MPVFYSEGHIIDNNGTNNVMIGVKEEILIKVVNAWQVAQVHSTTSLSMCSSRSAYPFLFAYFKLSNHN